MHFHDFSLQITFPSDSPLDDVQRELLGIRVKTSVKGGIFSSPCFEDARRILLLEQGVPEEDLWMHAIDFGLDIFNAMRLADLSDELLKVLSERMSMALVANVDVIRVEARPAKPVTSMPATSSDKGSVAMAVVVIGLLAVGASVLFGMQPESARAEAMPSVVEERGFVVGGEISSRHR